MRKLQDITKEYRYGKIEKPVYIEKMHEIHRILFDYSKYIRDTDISHIEISDQGIVMTTREGGIKMIVDENDLRIIPIEIINFGAHEKEEMAIVSQLIGNGMTVLDIGANIGWYTINVAMMKKGVTVHAFEPLPKTYNYLKKNIELNRINNVKLYNFGFSDKNDILNFYYYPEGSGNASLANVSEQKSVQEIKCRVMRLDDFMGDKPVSVDFIKCDVEGGELFVFRGGLKMLAEKKPIILTEMLRKWSAKFNYHPNQIISFLKDLGYRCFIPHNGQLKEFLEMDENTVETNFFFLHKEKHNKQLLKIHGCHG